MELIKKHGVRAGYEARAAVAPRKTTLASCTSLERAEIISWIEANYGPATETIKR